MKTYGGTVTILAEMNLKVCGLNLEDLTLDEIFQALQAHDYDDIIDTDRLATIEVLSHDLFLESED